VSGRRKVLRRTGRRAERIVWTAARRIERDDRTVRLRIRTTSWSGNWNRAKRPGEGTIFSLRLVED